MDNGATEYSSAHTYYLAFDASGMTEGQTKTLTVNALDRIGNVLQTLTVTVTGDTAVTAGDPATLTAAIPAEFTGATQNGTEEKAFEITYQWESSADGATWENMTGETDPTLTPDTSTAASTQYRYTVKVNGTSQTSDALALTVKPAAEISGEISDRTITVIVTGLADSIKATVIVAQYSGAKLVDVRMESVTGNGSDIRVEAAFTDENNEKGAAVQTDSSAFSDRLRGGTADPHSPDEAAVP